MNRRSLVSKILYHTKEPRTIAEIAAAVGVSGFKLAAEVSRLCYQRRLFFKCSPVYTTCKPVYSAKPITKGFKLTKWPRVSPYSAQNA